MADNDLITDNKKPKMYDLTTFYKMGIDPFTGLPLKMGSFDSLLNCKTKDEVKIQLRIKDEQTAVNRYTWYNLPSDITSQELEKFLYYRGQLCFFYFKELDKFFFMPYALDGTIDFYGRYNTIHPVPMTDGTDKKEKGDKAKRDLLSMKKLNCVYGIKLPEELTEEDYNNSAVILHDYTKQLGQNILPRQSVNEPLLDIMSEIFPYLRTALLTGTGIKGIRVNDADQADSVYDAARGMKNAALKGEPFIAMIGTTDFQELTDGATLKAEEFMMSYQSLDNYRLSLYGLENGGVFEKKAHTLNAEQAMNQTNTELVYQDGLAIRQHFCNIVNSIWDLGIWCEASEQATRLDLDGDGMAMDEDYGGENTGVDESGGDDYDE